MSGTPARGPGHGGPRRGWSRPPFTSETGREAALVHGARSAAVVSAVAAEIAPALLDAAPWLAGRENEREVAAWLRAEARVALLSAHAEVVGLIAESGEPREGLNRWLGYWERQAAAARDRLGLNPRSAVALRRDLAETARDVSLADELAKGRALRLAHEAREAAQEPADASPWGTEDA